MGERRQIGSEVGTLAALLVAAVRHGGRGSAVVPVVDGGGRAEVYVDAAGADVVGDGWTVHVRADLKTDEKASG